MASEEEGRRPTTAKRGTTHTKTCSACPDVKATSFCCDCHEYLCTDCAGYHKHLGVLRHHTLLTGEDFPYIEPPKRQYDEKSIIATCPDHPKEVIKYYCQKHDALCCVVCIVSGHELCAESYIHDIAETFKTGPEYGKLRTDIQGSEQLICNSIKDIDECLKKVGTLKAGEVNVLKQYRAKIIEYLDKRERELQAEMKRIHDKDVTLLHKLQAQLKTHQESLRDMKAKLKLHEKNSSELFIAAKRMCGQLAQVQSSLQKVTDNIGYQRYSIVRDTMMERILQDKGGFAYVEQIFGR